MSLQILGSSGGLSSLKNALKWKVKSKEGIIKAPSMVGLNAKPIDDSKQYVSIKSNEYPLVIKTISETRLLSVCYVNSTNTTVNYYSVDPETDKIELISSTVLYTAPIGNGYAEIFKTSETEYLLLHVKTNEYFIGHAKISIVNDLVTITEDFKTSSPGSYLSDDTIVKIIPSPKNDGSALLLSYKVDNGATIYTKVSKLNLSTYSASLVKNIASFKATISTAAAMPLGAVSTNEKFIIVVRGVTGRKMEALQFSWSTYTQLGNSVYLNTAAADTQLFAINCAKIDGNRLIAAYLDINKELILCTINFSTDNLVIENQKTIAQPIDPVTNKQVYLYAYSNTDGGADLICRYTSTAQSSLSVIATGSINNQLQFTGWCPISNDDKVSDNWRICEYNNSKILMAFFPMQLMWLEHSTTGVIPKDFKALAIPTTCKFLDLCWTTEERGVAVYATQTTSHNIIARAIRRVGNEISFYGNEITIVSKISNYNIYYIKKIDENTAILGTPAPLSCVLKVSESGVTAPWVDTGSSTYLKEVLEVMNSGLIIAKINGGQSGLYTISPAGVVALKMNISGTSVLYNAYKLTETKVLLLGGGTNTYIGTIDNNQNITVERIGISAGTNGNLLCRVSRRAFLQIVGSKPTIQILNEDLTAFENQIAINEYGSTSVTKDNLKTLIGRNFEPNFAPYFLMMFNTNHKLKESVFVKVSGSFETLERMVPTYYVELAREEAFASINMNKYSYVAITGVGMSYCLYKIDDMGLLANKEEGFTNLLASQAKPNSAGTVFITGGVENDEYPYA